MRRLLLYLLLMFSVAVQATETKWFMVATTTNNSTLNIQMSRVGFLLLADDSDAFSVVCNDGWVYNNVVRASFAQLDPGTVDVSAIEANDGIDFSMSASTLTISGVSDGETVIIYSFDSKELLRKVLSNGDNTISIGSLPRGKYILKVSETTVKFSKQ